MTTPNRNRSADIWGSLIAFGLLASLGPLLGWSNAELLWGLLLASLATTLLGVLLGVASLWRLAWQAPPPDPRQRWRFVVLTPFLVLFGAVLVVVCYGFHAAYALFVYFLFPLWPEIDSSFDLIDEQQRRMLLEAASRYWPFVVITLAADYRQLLRPLTDPRLLDFLRPWPLILRMHLFIIAAVGVMLTVGTGYALYLLILLFFFFPWRAAYELSARSAPPQGKHAR